MIEKHMHMSAEELLSAMERLRTLIADIKAWDVEHYMTIPHGLRARIQAELTDTLDIYQRLNQAQQQRDEQLVAINKLLSVINADSGGGYFIRDEAEQIVCDAFDTAGRLGNGSRS